MNKGFIIFLCVLLCLNIFCGLRGGVAHKRSLVAWTTTEGSTPFFTHPRSTLSTKRVRSCIHKKKITRVCAPIRQSGFLIASPRESYSMPPQLQFRLKPVPTQFFQSIAFYSLLGFRLLPSRGFRTELPFRAPSLSRSYPIFTINTPISCFVPLERIRRMRENFPVLSTRWTWRPPATGIFAGRSRFRRIMRSSGAPLRLSIFSGVWRTRSMGRMIGTSWR